MPFSWKRAPPLSDVKRPISDTSREVVMASLETFARAMIPRMSGSCVVVEVVELALVKESLR